MSRGSAPSRRFAARGGCWDFNLSLAQVAVNGHLHHVQRTPPDYADMFCGIRLARRSP